MEEVFRLGNIFCSMFFSWRQVAAVQRRSGDRQEGDAAGISLPAVSFEVCCLTAYFPGNTWDDMKPDSVTKLEKYVHLRREEMCVHVCVAGVSDFKSRMCSSQKTAVRRRRRL